MINLFIRWAMNVAVVITCQSAIWAYDFEVAGIYYDILSETEVAVACGNTESLWESLHTVQREAPLYPYDDWVENSYSGDVVIPASVYHDGNSYAVSAISDGAFVRCKDLQSVLLPSSLRTIGNGAFIYCEGLKELIVPDEVVNIGELAFCACSNLANLHYSLGCTYIPYAVISGTGWNCSEFSLSGLDNVTSIDYWGLTSAKIKEYPFPERLVWVSSSAFSGSLIEKVVIPPLVEGESCLLKPGVFSDCFELEYISLPANMVGSYNLFDIFYECSAVSLISIEAAVPPVLESEWASYVAPGCVLEVPEGSEQLYAQADYWKEFSTIRGVKFAGVDSLGLPRPSVQAVQGGVCLSDAAEAKIYSLSGICIYQGSDSFVPLAAGKYIVTIGNKSTKVMVR